MFYAQGISFLWGSNRDGRDWGNSTKSGVGVVQAKSSQFGPVCLNLSRISTESAHFSRSVVVKSSGLAELGQFSTVILTFSTELGHFSLSIVALLFKLLDNVKLGC